MEHLKDFVWMQIGNDEPVRVEANVEIISQKMVAGYSQVFPEIDQKEEAK